MTDRGLDFDGCYEGFSTPAHPAWAERTERLASESSWLVRQLAVAVLALEARWAPRFRLLGRVLRFLLVTIPTGIALAPLRLVAALGRLAAAAVRAVASVSRTIGRAAALAARSTVAAVAGAVAAVGRAVSRFARGLGRGFVTVFVRAPRWALTGFGRAVARGAVAIFVSAPRWALTGFGRAVAATVRVAARTPIRGGAVVTRAVTATAHFALRSARRGTIRAAAFSMPARLEPAQRLAQKARLGLARLERLEPADLIRPLQIAVSAVASLAVLALFAVTAHHDGPVTLHAALRSGSAAVLDDPSSSQPAAAQAGPSAAPSTSGSSTSGTPATVAPVRIDAAAAAAAKRAPLPIGKGMWLYMPAESEGGDVRRIVNKAKANGVFNLYVRTGSSYDGFYAGPFLDQLLPAAHAAGVRVIGWDFPYLKNADDDVSRAVAAINYTTPAGQHLDGFTADIEVGDGINLNPSTATTYSTHLRQRVGPSYPLIATVPKPNPALTEYPFAQLVPSFDAIAPMVYWLNDDPAADLTTAVAALKAYGKPIIPVGQAYDASGEGGPKGVPGRAAIQKFIATADQVGAVGVSFWSWQGASQEAWDALRDAPQFSLGAANPFTLLESQVRCYQALLEGLGYPVSLTGVMDPPTIMAIRQYQAAAHLPQSAMLDLPTQWALLTPVQAAPR